MKPSEAREILPGSGDLQEQIESLGGKISEEGAAKLLDWLAKEWISDVHEDDEIPDEDEDDEEWYEDEDEDEDDEDAERPDDG